VGAVRDRGADLNPLVVLGATGSIGAQALDVADHLGIAVEVIAAGSGSEALLALARSRPDAAVVVASPTPSEQRQFESEFGDRVSFGPGAVVAAAERPGSTVLNGIVGSAGLPASVAALRAGNRLALANKESLVAGGPVVEAARREGGGELVPVDSEHAALAECLAGEDPATVRRVILPASGGPFRRATQQELDEATVEQALAHPTWEMGRRITIDSATLMNKAFEVIETHWLFGFDYDRIDVVVHPESIVHGIAEFTDGSLKASIGHPDMRVPIQRALTHPERHAAEWGGLDLTSLTLHFEQPDTGRFPALRLGYEAGRAGGSAPAVLNAADEIAVQAFLDRRIGFMSIPEVVERTLGAVEQRDLESVDDVMDVDRESRVRASELVSYC
jgi:1-deoxy-D-xylulose-5-phosphate reductoisomerase